MSRQLRFDPPGGFHHVMHRGSRRQAIYEDDADRRIFLAGLAALTDRFDVRIHAYALMDNHYHLLVELPTGGISTAMKHMNSTYAQEFNRRHGYDGHLFRGRFRSILIGTDDYLVEVARYIHRNSTAAGLVADPVEDPWSSHRAYRDNTRRRWLTTDVVLDYFDGDILRFDAFVAAPDSAAARAVVDAVDHERPAVGPPRFLNELMPDQIGTATKASARRVVPVDVERFRLCEPSARVSVERDGPTVRDIDVLLVAARRQGGSIADLARASGINSASTVRSRVHRLEARASEDPRIERMIRAAETAE